MGGGEVIKDHKTIYTPVFFLPLLFWVSSFFYVPCFYVFPAILSPILLRRMQKCRRRCWGERRLRGPCQPGSHRCLWGGRRDQCTTVGRLRRFDDCGPGSAEGCCRDLGD